MFDRKHPGSRQGETGGGLEDTRVHKEKKNHTKRGRGIGGKWSVGY